MRGRGIRGRGRMGSGVLARTVIRSDSNMFAMLANQDGDDDDDSVLSDSDSENLRPKSEAPRKGKRQRLSSGGRSNGAEQVGDLNFDFDSLSSEEKMSAVFHKLLQVESKIESNGSMSKRLSNAETVIQSHQHRLKLLEYKSIDIECRSRRRNLIFWGIPERQMESKEGTIPLVMHFIGVDLGIERDMYIERAHRMGRFKPGVCRPVIAAFRDYQDTEDIMSNARKLKGTNLRVNRDYPVEIVEARKALFPLYKEYRDQNKYNKVSIQYPAKLLVNGVIKHDLFPDWSETMSGLRVDSRQLYVNSELRQRDSVNTGTTSHTSTQSSGAQIPTQVVAVDQSHGLAGKSPLENRSTAERSHEEDQAVTYRPWSNRPVNESDTRSTTTHNSRTNTTNAACGVSHGSSEGGNGHQSRSSRPDTMDTGQNPDQSTGPPGSVQTT